MALEQYVAKRHLGETTPEPAGGEPTPGLPTFVVQLHRATRLHYDFRLEADGVLKSWAVPKGPSQNPSDKRLAVMVEDHPMDYRTFEGIIPKGNYGAGTVMVWDEGHYAAPETHNREELEKAVKLGLHKGHVVVFLMGQKLKGLFDIIRIKGDEGNNWLLVKRPDEFANTEGFPEPQRSAVTGRTIEEIRSEANSEGRVWYSDRVADKIDLDDAPSSSMPHDIKPMLAQESQEPFDRQGWLFEVKWDGYRVIAEVELEGDIRLYSRNGLSFIERYPAVVSELRKLGHAAVLDGEVVALDAGGRSQFQWLQDYGKAHRGTLAYYVFDLLYLDGQDLRRLPLRRRKEILAQIVPKDSRIRVSGHVENEGCSFFGAISAQGLEGMMAKEAASVYEEGRRSRFWIKVKRLQHQAALVGGYTEGRNSRKHFGSLVLGLWEDGKFVYVGHTGGGFDDSGLKSLMAKLKPLKTPNCPFEDQPKTNMPATWVRPEVVVGVEFRGWTDSKLLRQPVFKGVLEGVDSRSLVRGDGQEHPAEEGNEMKTTADSPQRETAAEAPKGAELRRFPAKSGPTTVTVDGHELRLTNLDKVLWPEDGCTKGNLIDYYRGVAQFILPYLRDRPQSLNRHPNGIHAQGFFQKDMPSTIPKWLETVDVESGSEKKTIRYLLCQDEAALVYMANLACIEINPWHSRVPKLNRPDYAVIDLDPHEVGFDAVVKTALMVREVLDGIQVPGFPKTSGATGIHIYIPLGAMYETDQARQFAELIAQLVHTRLPAITSLERSPSKRVGKVYVDWLQNRDGQTLASAYSVRPKRGATVSTPLHWDEVNPELHPSLFTIRTILDRLEAKGDLWAPVLAEGVDIGKALERVASL